MERTRTGMMVGAASPDAASRVCDRAPTPWPLDGEDARTPARGRARASTGQALTTTRTATNVAAAPHLAAAPTAHARWTFARAARSHRADRWRSPLRALRPAGAGE